MDVLICTIVYPNDPTENEIPHRHFVGFENEEYIELYSISSIIGKESRVYPGGRARSDYYEISTEASIEDWGLSVPSFIDCKKSYRINSEVLESGSFESWNIPVSYRRDVELIIEQQKLLGRHQVYEIDSEQFENWNK